MNSHTERETGAVENPVMGRPAVVVALDKVNFKVFVLSHCRSQDEAEGLVDDYTKDPAKVEYMIVSSSTLRQHLAVQREQMAERMRSSFKLD